MPVRRVQTVLPARHLHHHGKPIHPSTHLTLSQNRTFADPDRPQTQVNTSQIGENLLSSDYVTSHPEITTILDLIPDSIQDDAEALLNALIRRLGIHDFYTANLMSYCEGYYEPGAVPNATLKLGSISRNFTYCSPRSADFQFDPKAALQRDLNASGNSWLDVSADLDWPDEVDQGMKYVHIVQRVAFAVYCAAAGLIALATLASALAILFSEGRLSACGNALLAALAFLLGLVASALATAVAVLGEKYINQYGEEVGISATAGRKFLGLTWAATAAMLICLVWWSVDCCCGRGRRSAKKQAKAARQSEKNGSFNSSV